MGFDGSQLVAVHPRLAAAGVNTWSWITTWRSCCASPAGCRPARHRWRRRGRQGGTAAYVALWGCGARPARGRARDWRRTSRCCCRTGGRPPPRWPAGIRAATVACTCSPDVVAVEARKYASATGGSAAGEAAWPVLERPRRPGAAVITLPCPGLALGHPTRGPPRRWPPTTSCSPGRPGGRKEAGDDQEAARRRTD